MKKGILTLALLLSVCSLWAEGTRVLLYGYVVEGDFSSVLDDKPSKEDPAPIESVSIHIVVGDSTIKTVSNRTTGFYSVILPAGADYKIKFSKGGFLPKTFAINAAELPAQANKEAYKLFTDVTLYPETASASAALVGNLVTAKCHFDNKKKRLMWDIPHAVDAFERFMRLADPERMAARVTQ